MSEELNEKEVFQCTDCGAEVNENANFCPKCGVRFDENKNENTLTKAKRNLGSKVIGFIVTFLAIAIASSISPIIKYCSNSQNFLVSDYDEWETIDLYDIGIKLKSPFKLNHETSSSEIDGFTNVIYTGGESGFEIAVVGATIGKGYSYDLEKGAVGSMNALENQADFSNLDYSLSNWSNHNFENKVARGTIYSKGVKGNFVSLFGLKGNKMFSILIMILPSNDSLLDLAELQILSIDFL
jgi:hypothetical protein